MMEKVPNQSDWIHTIICSRDEMQYYMGMHDSESNVDFIPVFKQREDAETCLQSLDQKPGIDYQVMAVLHTELAKNCSDKNYSVALVDHSGKIIRQFGGEE